MFTHIKFICIPIQDQKKALEFYTQKLDFKLLENVPFDDKQNWIELQVGDSETQCVLFTLEGHEGRVGTFLNCSFHCENIQKTYQDLKSKGVTCLHEPKQEEWGSYFLIQDPDKNTLCISS